MKRKPEDYIDCGYYEPDDSVITHHTEKVVKCRKEHMCMGECGKTIQQGDYALLEKGFMDGAPFTSYTCISCLDAWLDLIEPIVGAESEANHAE